MLYAVALSAGLAHAQEISFDLDANNDMGLDTHAVETRVGGAIQDQLNLADPDSYLGHFANAAVTATKGMGVDYASNPEKFSVGGTLGTAVSGVPPSFVRGPDSLPEGGYAFMASLYGGVNLGVLTAGDKGPLEHVLLYVNGLGFSPPSTREFRASMFNLGAHAQVKLGGPVSLKAFEWGGVDLTGGYEQSFYRLQLSKGLPITQDVSGSSVTWTAEGNFELSATSSTIPLEVSSNLRLTLLTAYLGFGYDLVPGATAVGTASLGGPVSASDGGRTEDLGSASVALAAHGLADPNQARVFVGAQANILVLKVFGHLNLGLNQTYGGFVGVRLAL